MVRIKGAARNKKFADLLVSDIRDVAKAPLPLVEPHSSSQSNVVIKEWLRAAQESASMIGRMPPAPSTLRAKAGSFLVRAIQRMLFWYTPQIKGFNSAILGLVQEQNKLIERLLAELSSLKQGSDQAELARAAIQGTVATFQSQLGAIDSRMSASESRIGSGEGRIGSSEKRLDASEKWRDLSERRLDASEKRIDAGELRLDILDRARVGDADAVRARSTALEEKIVQIRTMFFAQQRLQAASRSAPAAGPQTPAPQSVHEFDDMYLMLEDKLRGSRAEIKSRLLKYLPYVENAGGAPRVPVIDLGSGRGEWLEVLSERSFEAVGIDTNNTFLSLCSGLGLQVVEGDAIQNLEKRESESAGMITGFHIIEHLPWGQLVRLVDESLRVLKPGGAVIFETPDPDNVQVGSRNFYFDPTHRNPLPSLLMEFLLEARGFMEVTALHMHPYPETMRVPEDGSELAVQFNRFFYGPQDYAVIGRKPIPTSAE